MFVRSLIAVLFVLSSGCATAASGMFATDGFHHRDYSYRVGYVTSQRVASPDWLVDNWSRSPQLQMKRGPRYRARIGFDVNGDGVQDLTEEFPRYDLLLANRRNAGSMWIRTVPMPTRFAETELRVLSRLYVDAASGAGIVVTQIGGRAGAIERRFATRVIEEGPTDVAGFEAYRVRFEVANVDQLELEGERRWERAEVIFVRAGFLHEVRRSRSYRSVNPVFPVYLVLGYSNLPEDFEASYGDFEQLRASVDFFEREFAELRRGTRACLQPDLISARLVGQAPARLWSPVATASQNRCLSALDHAVLAGRSSYGTRTTPFEAPTIAPQETDDAGSAVAPDSEPEVEAAGAEIEEETAQRPLEEHPQESESTTPQE